jgi:hypothetical protein
MEDLEMKSNRLDACAGYGAAMLLSIVGMLALSCRPAEAAHRSACVRCVAPIRYAAPVAVAAPYYYRVGAQLQQQAADTYGFRNSAEWSEFLQLKGYKAGVESMLQASYQSQAQQLPATAAEAAAPAAAATVRGTFEAQVDSGTGGQNPGYPPAGTPTHPLPPGLAPPGPGNTTPAPGPGETLPIPPQTPTPPDGGAAVAYPVLAANCAKCHSGTEPKGAIWLDGTVDLRGDDAAETRDKIVRVLWLGHMPPDTPASDATVGQILSEIYVE